MTKFDIQHAENKNKHISIMKSYRQDILLYFHVQNRIFVNKLTFNLSGAFMLFYLPPIYWHSKFNPYCIQSLYRYLGHH